MAHTSLAGWRRRIELYVELGLRGSAVGGFQWDVSAWDDGSGWSGLEPTFVALEGSELERLKTQRGRRSGAERHKTGTASIGLVWREPAGHWHLKDEGPVEIGQELRVRARIDGASDLIPIYRGTVRDLVDEWDPDTGAYRVTAGLSDRKADLASVDLPERAVEGLGDTTDARLLRILGLAGVSPYFADLEPDTVEMSSSNFARNLLDEAEVTVEGAGGDFYVDRAGLYRYRPRGWVATAPRSADTQLTWSNVLGDEEAARPLSFRTAKSLEDVVNQVSYARAGGTAYTAGPDPDSSIRYGLRTYQRFDLPLRYDADVETQADARLAELKEKTQRLEELTHELNPRATTEALTRWVDVELGDRHELIWDDGSGDLFAEAYHVQGVSHDIDAEHWRISARLWHYEGTSIPPEVAKWGSATWGVSKWS